MDTLSSQQTSIHQLDPRAKLITSLVFITTVISFGKYEISALIPYFVYPVFLGVMGNVPPVYLLKKLLLVSPFAVMIGIFNPLMDRDILVSLGGIEISGGWVSFVSILIRFVLTVGAALTLIAVTGFNTVCMALDKLGTPRVFVIHRGGVTADGPTLELLQDEVLLEKSGLEKPPQMQHCPLCGQGKPDPDTPEITSNK
jgi:cobalt/nickel transport system permease protein